MSPRGTNYDPVTAFSTFNSVISDPGKNRCMVARLHRKVQRKKTKSSLHTCDPEESQIFGHSLPFNPSPKSASMWTYLSSH